MSEENILVLTIIRKNYLPKVRLYTNTNELIDYLNNQLDKEDVEELLYSSWLVVDEYKAEFSLTEQTVNPSKFD